MDTIFDGLITDRTRADAERATYLLSLYGYDPKTNTTVWYGTEAEWAELNASNGLYKAIDLNRVETAVRHAADLMTALPEELKEYEAKLGVAHSSRFDVPYDPAVVEAMETKTDWAITDVPVAEDMERYLSNILTLCNAWGWPTGSLPKNMEYLTWSRANAIEKAVKAVGDEIKETRTELRRRITVTATWNYSGELYAGER